MTTPASPSLRQALIRPARESLEPLEVHHLYRSVLHLDQAGRWAMKYT
jgi:hypothetical protein